MTPTMPRSQDWLLLAVIAVFIQASTCNGLHELGDEVHQLRREMGERAKGDAGT